MSATTEIAQLKTSEFMNRIGGMLLPATTIIIVLVTWEIIVELVGIPSYILPKPSAIAQLIVADFMSGEIQPHMAVTVFEIVVGLLIAAGCGLALGTVIGMSTLVERTFYPVVLVIQTVPKVAIAPLLIIWFGYGVSSKIAIVALLGFFPIMVNVIAGIKTGDLRRIDLMRMMGASQWQIYTKVRFPNMLNYLFAGLEVAVVFCVIGAIVGEFVGSSVGLGSLIIQRQSQVNIAGVFSVLAYLSVTAFLMTMAVKYASTKIVFWRS